MKALPACMYIYHVCACCVWRSEEENRAHGNGTTDGSGPSWKSFYKSLSHLFGPIYVF